MEGESALTIRKRLLNPPNAVPDPGIDLRRKSLLPPPPEPPQELPEPVPPEEPPSPSNILQFVPRGLTVMHIIEMVAHYTGFTAADILGTSRKYHVTFARHAAVYLCTKHFPKRSLPHLGMVFNKDHTSIMHARDRMRRHADSNSPEGVRLRQIVMAVEDKINGNS